MCKMLLQSISRDLILVVYIDCEVPGSDEEF
jgi:hypothetical protein